MFLLASMFGVVAAHVGVWSSRPLWTPSCVNGAFPGTEQDPTRTFCCQDGNPACIDKFQHTQPNPKALPPYTTDSRRDHHHVGDGPIIGNGNIGVSIGSGNRWNISYNWLDFFYSTNSYWAITGANHTSGEPFRGRLALPGRMLLGVARLTLPVTWTNLSFQAVQNFDDGTVEVNLTQPSLGATLTVRTFASPRAPIAWTSLSLHDPKSSLQTGSIAVTLNTSVLPHFYHREPRFNTSFAVPTSASCGIDGATTTISTTTTSTGEATVMRSTEFVDAPAPTTVQGAIHHSVRAPSTCTTDGHRGSAIAFTVASGAPPVQWSAIVRTSRDPSCVARPMQASAPLCGLSSHPGIASQHIAADLRASNASWASADAERALTWATFWNASSISLPGDPQTENFWYGALAALNSAIPHAGQELTPPGLYGPWVTQDNPGWHGDFTIDYNYEAIFYGVMSSNHPELMLSYPLPMLDFIPKATAYAQAKSRQVLGHACPGLHFPDVMAPWGFQEGANGVNEDAGLMSNGAYANLPLVWEWEYGDRGNFSEIEERSWPLLKGNADFYACWMQYNASTGFYHDLHDCTNESPGACSSSDTVLTLSMARRTLQVATEMATAMNLTANPQWSVVLDKLAPLPVGSFYDPEAASGMSGDAQMCSWCAWHKDDKTRTPTVGDCQYPGTGHRGLNGNVCNKSVHGVCPQGMGLCRSKAFGSCRRADGSSNMPSGGNSQSIFPAFPADHVGTNHSLAAVAAATIDFARSWQQGNSFTKIFSAAARLVAPGLLTADMVHTQWRNTLDSTQQPNGVPYNPFSGFETVGAIEYVNYMLLQSDPGGFLGLFEAWPWQKLGAASFKRLRGRGAFLVSSSIDVRGVVGATTVTSMRGERLVVRRPQSWSKAALAVTSANGANVLLSWSGKMDEEFFSFITKKGSTYSFTIHN